MNISVSNTILFIAVILIAAGVLVRSKYRHAKGGIVPKFSVNDVVTVYPALGDSYIAQITKVKSGRAYINRSEWFNASTGWGPGQILLASRIELVNRKEKPCLTN